MIPINSCGTMQIKERLLDSKKVDGLYQLTIKADEVFSKYQVVSEKNYDYVIKFNEKKNDKKVSVLVVQDLLHAIVNIELCQENIQSDNNYPVILNSLIKHLELVKNKNNVLHIESVSSVLQENLHTNCCIIN